METKIETASREQEAQPNVDGKRGRWLYYLAALVSLVGLADAVYLTIGHLTGMNFRCTLTGGCNEVLGSSYASIGSIPLASFGALAYFSVFSLATVAAYDHRRASTALLGLAA